VKLDPGVPGQNSFGQGVSFAANRLLHVDFYALLSLLSSGLDSERKPAANRRSKVTVVEIGNAGLMRNGDGQAAAHEGISKPGKTVETMSEAMIGIERPLVERARAGAAETG
jgi:hypothetical protein